MVKSGIKKAKFHFKADENQVWVKQVKLTKENSTLGLHLQLGFYRIPFDSGFGVDRFHCIMFKLPMC